MSHAVNLRECRVSVPDWLTRQPAKPMDSTSMHHIGNLLGLTAFVAGVAELGRVMVEPMTGPLFAVGPPITPEDWERWWPLMSSVAVSLVGLWGMVQNKLKGGVKADLEAIRDELSEIRESAIAKRADTKQQFEELAEILTAVKAKVEIHDRIIEAARHKSRERRGENP